MSDGEGRVMVMRGMRKYAGTAKGSTGSAASAVAKRRVLPTATTPGTHKTRIIGSRKSSNGAKGGIHK